MNRDGQEREPAARGHNSGPEGVVHLPIDGTLDLHAFSPGEVKYLVPDYLEECRRRGIRHVRIIHGKGTGTLRRTVHAILDRIDMVRDYRIAGEDGGSWGATLVSLRLTG